ncbi:hypothetical protein H6G80_26420 [Nostoc sp. FACHB-87]|uniref:hypothetical protein n=1 Tax=Nostocaceae TaxID=1162 RepID=UPI0016860D1A|nr:MULTISPECIES: hypothetical protein [Nostocaceae]MBD2457595.1 hypothetical protein [Nostoc sp. FACHB-87]MBD2477510.1 hypothetical protein [Anabaena sp. FACHB-83]
MIYRSQNGDKQAIAFVSVERCDLFWECRVRSLISPYTQSLLEMRSAIAHLFKQAIAFGYVECDRSS